MGAKYGIASIGCFILAIAVTVAPVLSRAKDDTRSLDMPLWLMLAPWLLEILGILLGIIGTVKKEKPRALSIIGFSLNFILLFFPFLLVLFAFTIGIGKMVIQ